MRFIKKTVFLILTFTITIYKSLRLLLLRVILNFKYKNFTSSLNYLILLEIWAIKDIIFKIYFLLNRFLKILISLIRKKTAKELDRRYNIIKYLKRLIT